MQVVCIAEDRPSCEPSLPLLLASLQRHCRDQRIELFYPVANDHFILWLDQFPAVKLNPSRVPGAYGWNVKPQAILNLFDRGYNDVLWIDSDVLIMKNFHDLFRDVPSEIMIVTEEALYGSHEDPEGLRARLWGFEVKRILPFSVNTAIIRATRNHYDLLERWKSLLEGEQYRDAQHKEWFERPPHLLGDQDVLTALLTSEMYSEIPLRFLLRGKQIIHSFGPYGYTVGERINNMIFGMPEFIHSQGMKPWLIERNRSLEGCRQRFNCIYLEVSPYTLCALEYRHQVGDWGWMRARSVLGRILRAWGFCYAPLTGVPLALAADAMRITKGIFRAARDFLGRVFGGFGWGRIRSRYKRMRRKVGFSE